MDDTSKPTIDDFLAWGLYYETLLKEPTGSGIQWTRPMLDYYVAAANEALRQQCEREHKRSLKKSGRPRGGMGEQKMRLEAAGVRPEDADRITMRAHGKTTVEPVHRAYDAARKKPPR
jgi:hypothetical protein